MEGFSRVRYLCLWMICLLWIGHAAQVQALQPPNIVIILADDMGYGDNSPYGGWIETPNLDRLTAEGMRFTDFHSNGPVCSPTRAALLTGRYQQRAGLELVVHANPKGNRRHGLQPEEITFAELAKGVGMATGIFGKWHLGYERQYNPVHQGFDEFRGYVSGNVDYFAHVDAVGFYDWWDGDELINEHGYTTHLITEHAVRFIDEHAERPFVLHVPQEAPHFPYQGPNDEPFRFIGEHVREERDPDRVRRAYREMVEELDASIGRIVEALERNGLADNTLLFFTSDNGALEFGSNGELRGLKGSVWEGGHRVPAIAWWPGHIPGGTTTDVTALTMDLMPTIRALVGASDPPAPELDGVNLLPVLTENGSLAARTLFWQFDGQAAVRRGEWKLVVDGEGQTGVALYDLSTDLSEARDLSDRHPERVRELAQALRRWRQEVTRTATVQPSKLGNSDHILPAGIGSGRGARSRRIAETDSQPLSTHTDLTHSRKRAAVSC